MYRCNTIQHNYGLFWLFLNFSMLGTGGHHYNSVCRPCEESTFWFQVPNYLTTICSVLHANYSSTMDCGVQLSAENWITWSGFLIQTKQTVNHFPHRLLPRPSCHRCLLRQARL